MTVELALATAAGVAILMVAAWLVSLMLADVSIVDIVWGIGFVAIAWIAVVVRAEGGTRLTLAAILATVWGLRLAGYLAWRNLGKGEDYRYVAMRRRHGRRFPLVSLFVVFGLQGLLMWIVALPVQAATGSQLGALDALGVAVWTVGMFFETVGDIQLAAFKRRPESKGQVLDTGLWRYTRHPNYFGDFLVWWGLYLIALAGGAWWTAIGPVVMSGLLLRYSGVGLLEKTIGSRRPGYEDYMRRTNAFFPGPPR